MTTAHSLRVGRRHYPVVLPRRADPRLHLAAVIVSVQILGQTLLDFELSIAQILTSLATCAFIELAVTFRHDRAIVWPGSALLTGNGVALILRVPGTEHGDWWSMRGWYYFAGVAAVSLLTKYVVRYRGMHVFNPSNVGLVAAFVLLGSDRIEPLDFWWGPWSPGVALATLIIVLGGVVITSRLGFLGMAAGFWVSFAISLAVVALGGHCMTATWRFGPICGASFWWVLVTSPEVLIFLFFMITDPKTTPSGRAARVVFGVAVGVLAALLAAPQETEFATKVAVLASLVLVCAARYPLMRVLPAAGSDDDSLRAWISSLAARTPRPRVAGAGVVAVATIALVGGLLAAGAPARPAAGTASTTDTAVLERAAAVDTSALPPLTVSEEMRRINPGFGEADARLLAFDALSALEAERDALLAADVGIAARGATLVRLDDLAEKIAVLHDGGTVDLPTYAVESITVVPVYDPKNAQSGPQLGVQVRGTVTAVPLSPTSMPGSASGAAEPIERVFAMYLDGDHYLIAADYPVG